MRRRLKQTAVVFVFVFIAAQLVRPERANPPTVPSRTFAAQSGSSSGLATVLDRACGDCHSNRTVWPWYTQVAPVSWLMASAVHEGRKAVNFSDWAAYSPEQQRMLLAASCSDVSNGTMPGPWTLLHPETRVSNEEIGIICAAAGKTDARGPGVSR